MDEKNILLCEDEDAIREFVIINLQRSGYNVTGVNNGEAAVEEFVNNGGYSVVLLDVMLPGMDGFAVCKKIRSMDRKVGIIMLSAKSQEMDKINGLMLGADDYITKPFSPAELLARIDSLMRRVEGTIGGQSPDSEIKSGPFVLNQKSRTLTKNGETIDLTQVEFQLMEQLMKHPNEAIERQDLLKSVWGEDYLGEDKIVDVNVRRLRIKIEEEPGSPKYLCTVWGFGYKWTV